MQTCSLSNVCLKVRQLNICRVQLDISLTKHRTPIYKDLQILSFQTRAFHVIHHGKWCFPGWSASNSTFKRNKQCNERSTLVRSNKPRGRMTKNFANMIMWNALRGNLLGRDWSQPISADVSSHHTQVVNPLHQSRTSHRTKLHFNIGTLESAVKRNWLDGWALRCVGHIPCRKHFQKLVGGSIHTLPNRGLHFYKTH